MKKITFLGNFRVDYSSESHHAKTLEGLGYQVVRMQETETNTVDIFREAMQSDLFIWIHTHGWKNQGALTMQDVLVQLKAAGIPTMTYHLDLWLGISREADLTKHTVYQDIGHFFTVDSKMAKWFDRNTSVKGHYLPAGVYDKEATYTPTNLVNDVIFVGSKGYHPEWPYRPELINWLDDTYHQRFKHYGNGGLPSIRGQELNNLYASTKVVVGDTLCMKFTYPDYWSDRIYETIGRGGFLIHPYISGLEREFEDKKHVVFYEYGNLNQLKELIDYYLEHDDEREAIRLAGHELVKKNYTYANRWKSILEELGIE